MIKLFNCTQSNSRYLLAMAVALLMIGIACAPMANKNRSLAGCWIRENDVYSGWIIEISEVEAGEYEAKSLWVPEVASANAFQIGEKKIRRIRLRGDGTYIAESMARDPEGNPSYTDDELTFSDRNQIALVADSPTNQTGDRQIWRRLKTNEIGMAYADYGRGRIERARQRFAVAAASYQSASKRLLQEKEPETHRNLVNALAWDLATSRATELDDPKLASQLLPFLGDWFNHNDTAAAVFAANGEFDKAVELQEKALSQISEESANEVYLHNIGLNPKNLFLQINASVLIGGQKREFNERLQLYRTKKRFLE
jgi:tetratricopeptide (TPR) repeat protein